MAAATAYFLGGTDDERDRLLRQGEGLQREARWLLDRLDVRPGWRVVDVGCGPLGLLELFAERVGDRGHVVGVEREPRFAAMARTLLAQRQVAGVEVVCADAQAADLPAGSFDLAHERLVLITQPHPEQLLARMVALVRPGGVVAVQDVDQVSWLCYPPHPAWEALQRAFWAVCRARGIDPFLGRRLPELLRAGGLTEVDVAVHAAVDRPGEYRRTHMLALLESLRDQVLALGVLSAGDLAAALAAVRRHLDQPTTLVVRELLFQAWGRKPEVAG
jgi:SAM-dependent methyltransferase